MSGAPEGTRTPGLLLRRQLLYPAELLARIPPWKARLRHGDRSGAGDGNRTHTTSLEGWDSTVELHPRINSSSGFYITILPDGVSTIFNQILRFRQNIFPCLSQVPQRCRLCRMRPRNCPGSQTRCRRSPRLPGDAYVRKERY